MYPLLIAAFVAQAPDNFPDFQYPDEVRREGFRHIPLLSYCRTQAMSAIVASGGLADMAKSDYNTIRWRASVAERGLGALDADKARLELFTGDADGPLTLVYSAPLCGPEFNKLPLVLRLGLELLIRKECKGGDPE